jgi:endonuclease/exonuclease/phosphatase family metal-dependent hydrolase
LIKFFRRFIFTFNIIAVIFLIGSYLSVLISPAEAWMFSLLGLAYPFILIVNILFALFWLFQLKIQATLSVAAIVIGSSFFNQSFQFRKEPLKPESDIKLVSYNAGLFGYFQSRWHMNELANQINELEPDVLCIQEFLNLRSNNTSTMDSLKKVCGFKYSYFQALKDGRKKGEYGMAIFSQFKILETALVHFDGLTGNMCFYADLQLDSGVYRFYNVHLQSFKFKKQDYKFVTQLPEDNDEKIKQSKGLLKRMKSAYLKRSEQVEKIREHILESTVPYFVMGDFNDPPVSYSYSTLSKGLKDAFVENGFGMGRTYIGMMPNFRIDYILYPKQFEGSFYKTYKLSSDHSLVATGLKYKNE